jgi:hypothetical protein
MLSNKVCTFSQKNIFWTLHDELVQPEIWTVYGPSTLFIRSAREVHNGHLLQALWACKGSTYETLQSHMWWEKCPIPSSHLLVLATCERFLPTWGTFRAILASESHWLQRVLVLSIRWGPTPACVGRVLLKLPSMRVCQQTFVMIMSCSEGKPEPSYTMMGEICGHNHRLRSLCLQVQPVTCWHTSLVFSILILGIIFNKFL